MKPWLWLPARLAHDLSPLALRSLAAVRAPHVPRWRPLVWRGLSFDNPLGLAGGVDKDGSGVRGWWALGAGFVEVGTVTPLPQRPNPGVIMERDLPARALWNKMGFPSVGAERVARALRRLPRPHATPVFVNVGKNRDTPNELAAGDYVACLHRLAGLADAFVINVSSPNTKGLRDLQGPSHLREFLRPIVAERDAQEKPVPLLLKLSPDLDAEGIRRAAEQALDLGVDGFVTTNTTLARESTSVFPAHEGGVSGAPLAERSKAALRELLTALGPRRAGLLVVSVGGVLSAADAIERLEMGADLVQAYSALVFEGPRFFAQAAKDARALDAAAASFRKTL